jgi:hypothetical protein
MLLANPHLPWSDLFVWYEAQITAPGIDAYGATLVGLPVLAIAFNNNLGWTHTVNTMMDGMLTNCSSKTAATALVARFKPLRQKENLEGETG